jgi:hypothetical protein
VSRPSGKCPYSRWIAVGSWLQGHSLHSPAVAAAQFQRNTHRKHLPAQPGRLRGFGTVDVNGHFASRKVNEATRCEPRTPTGSPGRVAVLLPPPATRFECLLGTRPAMRQLVGGWRSRIVGSSCCQVPHHLGLARQRPPGPPAVLASTCWQRRGVTIEERHRRERSVRVGVGHIRHEHREIDVYQTSCRQVGSDSRGPIGWERRSRRRRSGQH